MYVFLPTRRQRGRVWQLKLAASLRDVEHNRGLRRVQRPPGFTQLRFKIKSDDPQIRGAESRPLRAGTARTSLYGPNRSRWVDALTDWLGPTTTPHKPRLVSQLRGPRKKTKQNPFTVVYWNAVKLFPLCECALSWSAVSVSCLGCSPASTVWSKYGDRS